MEKAWWKEAVVYQVYPRSFMDSDGDGVGDLAGITQRLDYLKELGIDVIWLSPVYRSPNDDNGYDISDYRAIMPDFGTMEDFDRMLERAHALGIRIVMDLVVNHTSDEHPWFVESRSSRDNPYRDYYIWKDPVDGHEPNNWGSCFSGSAWKFDERTGQYFLHLFSTKQPDLNWENPKVRQEVWSLMRFWLDKGIDGFRMDVISLISKDQTFADGEPGLNGYTSFNVSANGPRVHEFLQEMRASVLDHYDTLTVGECSGVTLEEAKKYANAEGTELNMAFQFEHTSLDHDPETGNKWTDRRIELPALKACLSRWQKGMEGVAWNSLFWDNHDQPRIVSRLGDDGEYRERSAKMLAICLHMMQGTPYIYQGEELGMTNVPFASLSDYRDLDSINAYRELVEEKGLITPEDMMRALHRMSRDNARTPMQWTAGPNAGFTQGTPWIGVNPNHVFINAEEQLARPDSVFHCYQKLISLRKAHDIITYGTYDLLDSDDRLWVYTRTLNEERLLVVCSFSGEEVPFEVPEEFRGGECLISNLEDRAEGVLRPWEAYVLRVGGRTC